MEPSRFLKQLVFIVLLAVTPGIAPAVETAADLSALTLSTGGLSPAFHREVTAYASTVPFPGVPLTLDGTPVSPATASVRTRLNGAPSLAGLPQSLSLRPGQNRIDLRVTASGAALADFPLAAGSTRNLALHPDGRILQWGVTASDTPGALPAATQAGVTAVFSGPAGEYYLKDDGALYLLSGMSPATEVTKGYAGISQPRVVAVDVGTNIAAGLRADGTVRIWGLSSSTSTAGVVSIAAGYDHVLALRSDGRVWASGISNSYGQSSVPAAARSGIVAIAAHKYRNLALRADGTLVQWGQVSTAQAAIPAEATDIAAIDLNDNSNFVLTRSGAVIAWGNTASTADTPPAEAAADVVAIKAGPRHILALKADGSLITWGTNSSGQPALAPSGFDPLFTPPLRDYVVRVERLIPSPALASLETSGGALSPAFAPDTLAYSQSVPYGTSAVDLSATPLTVETASVRYRLNGAPAQSVLPASLPLRVGLNRIQLRVTAAGAPLADFPFSVSPTRCLALSSSGAVMQALGSNITLPAESQSGVAGVFSGPYGEYAVKTDGSLIRLSGGEIPAAAQPVSPDTAIAAVAVGGSHALLLRADGTTYAWGANSYGQTAIPPDAQSGIVAVSCASNYSVALRADGRVVAWGQTSFGQATVPPELKSDIVGICAYGSGNYGSHALRADGRVFSWGDFAASPPVAAQSGIVAIAADETTAYALTQDGAIVAWAKSTGTLKSVPASLQSGVVAIAAGSFQLLTLKSDGTVEGWDFSGNGAPLSTTFPSPLVDAPVRFYHLSVERRLPTALSALAPALGSFSAPFAPETDSHALAAPTPYRGLALYGLPFLNHARLEVRSGTAEAFRPVVPGQTLAYLGSTGGAALRADGSVLGWGSYPAPAAAQSDVVSLAGSQHHLLALKADGSLVAWGYNLSGQTNLPAGLRATAIAAGDNCSVVLLPDGLPAVIGGPSSLRTPPADAIDLVAISAGAYHAMGLRRDGRVVAWGSPASATTVPADAQAGIVAIAAGGGQCYALRADGRVVSWGSGAYGLDTVPASATYGVVAIACGNSHAVALRADGSVVSWGRGFASLPRGFLPDIVALATSSDSVGFGITTAILRDGSLIQIDSLPYASPPSEFSSGRFAVPLHSLLPLSPGANNLELRVTSRDGSDTRTYTIAAPRSAAPELSLSIPSLSSYPLIDGGFSGGGISTGALSLGYLKVGCPIVTPWVLANTGSADLIVDSGSLLGVNASEFVLSGLSFPFTLGPGEQLAFNTTTIPADTGFRTATLTLSANLPHGAPYTLPLRVEGLTTASVLASWRSSRFTAAELADPALEATVWGNLADPDGDGLPNLLEHALYTAPKTPNLPPSATLDATTPGAPRLTLTYTRVKRTAAAGIVYRVEWSDTLASGSWNDAGVTEQVIPATGPLTNTAETVIVSVAAGSPARFLRLRVTAP